MLRMVGCLALLAGCRWGFALHTTEADSADGQPDSVDTAIPCAYECTFDATNGATTCAAPITPTVGPTDELVAVIDMTGHTELSLLATICDPLMWTLHIGDSPTNNGFGGDSGQFANDAEVQLVDEAMTMYSNQYDTSAVLQTVSGIVNATGCTTLSGVLSDQHAMFSGAATFDVTSEFALRLDPPADSEGVPDALWYLGANRTYASAGRTGTGLRQLELCLR